MRCRETLHVLPLCSTYLPVTPQHLHQKMPFCALHVSVFIQEASLFHRKEKHSDGYTALRRFRGLFGVTPKICALVWNKLIPTLPNGSRPKHLLWSLLFLKVYGSENIHATLAGTDEKTFRKWCWIFVSLISGLDVIQWSERLQGRESSIYKVSVDGTDVPICEPIPFNPKWYSHKFSGPGLRYEIGMSIATGNIVWVYGPFPCGSHTDLKIFRLRMKGSLLQNEKVVADGGYRDERSSAGSSAVPLRYWSYIRARHEAVNKRLKQFNVLKHRFRHRLSRHSVCFHAVAHFTYLLIKDGEPVFV